ncbi:hypothetical protein NUW58_g9253 [Xylaria curta]|uniref:Uncharacterized protein n=1 Tax=Xylaria curta TaxID=42375 RepID=A0ACC1MYN6_9PEZI|nr:hypothetical protein NUW58_g9253 [Xylaria curta]
MSTPFICQRCTARLARPAFRLRMANQLLLHTRTIPAERPSHPVISPIQHDLGQKPELSQSEQPRVIIEENRDDHFTSLPISLASPHGQDDGTELFPANREPSVKQPARLQSADNTHEPNETFETTGRQRRALWGYNVAISGGSHSEERHAVGQLRRWLRDRPVTISAKLRIEQFEAWKKGFFEALQHISATSSVEQGNSGTRDASSETVSHKGETASMTTAWQSLDGDEREGFWPQMILSTLKSEPHTVPTLIYSTFDPSWCPSYAVEDTLYLLLRRRELEIQKGAPSNGSQIQQEIKPLVTFVLSKCPPGYLALEQTVLHLVFSLSPTSELIQHYELLKTIGHPLHNNTLMHLASRFAKGFDTKAYAVDILQTLTDSPGFDINTPVASSICTSLLSLNENEPLPDQRAAPDALFEFLLNRGLRPNILGLSGLMRNFCIRGHLETAWKIFDIMLQHGVEPDRHVFSILLNGSKRNLDSASLERIFHIIASRDAWFTILLNDFLDFLYQENESQPERRRRQRKKANNAWRPMFRLYAKFYDLAPLQRFTLFPLKNLFKTWDVQPKYSTPATRMADSLTPRPDNKLIQPDNTTLCIMISAHMRSLLFPKWAIRYYYYFMELVEQKDPAMLSLLAEKRTMVFDILLRTLMQFSSTTGFAIRQLQKMIVAADEEKARLGHNLYHHPPSAHTWTIILNGLKNHADIHGVVAVLDMMTNIGRVQPTLPVWNATIQAFSRARHVSGAVKAVWSLEKAGFHADDRTIKAFRMLPKSLLEQATAQLEKMRKAPDNVPYTTALPQDFVMNPTVSPTSRPRLGIPATLEEIALRQEQLDIFKSRLKRQEQLNTFLKSRLRRQVFKRSIFQLD